MTRTTPAVATAGTTVAGRYRILGELGSGSMGMVLRVVDSHSNDREVALKMIRPEFGLDRQFRDQFMHEARALARVRHRNVVSLLEIGVHDGLPYFVMEYVPGPTLRDWLEKRGGTLAVDEALGFLTQICQGAHAIHGAGVVHRDLKPSNILIGPGFRVAVADLGLAVLDPVTIGGSGSVAGTLAYLAPEVMLAEPTSRELAPRADIYALGVIAFELLTGTLPYEGDDPAELLSQRLEQPPRITDVRPDLPPAFDDVLAAALAADPRDRTADAMALSSALFSARPRG